MYVFAFFCSMRSFLQLDFIAEFHFFLPNKLNLLTKIVVQNNNSLSIN
jgi:hypothetical protein